MGDVIKDICSVALMVFILCIIFAFIFKLGEKMDSAQMKYYLEHEKPLLDAERDRKIKFCVDKGGVAKLGSKLEFNGCDGAK